MAAKKAKKQTKTRSPKASGPVHMLRAYMAKLKLDSREATGKVVEFAAANKLEKGTALTQLSRFRKEQGIVMRAASGTGGKKKAAPKKKAKAKKKAAPKARASSAAPQEAAAVA